MQFDKLESCREGRLGGTYVSGTGVNTGKYGRIQALTACTFTTLTGNISGGASMTLPAGAILRGYFTVVTLAGGTAVLYNAD
jgi:hypothetical protein